MPASNVTLYAEGTLAEALDNSSTWETSGDATWTGQNLVTHDSVDAAESGIITGSQS
jgi:hypothetical protein